MTISSSNGITDEEEPRLPGLFPDVAISRAKRFRNKRVGNNCPVLHFDCSNAQVIFGMLSLAVPTLTPRGMFILYSWRASCSNYFRNVLCSSEDTPL